MPIDPLELPHILKAITDLLSFDDRLSCVPVSHAWNNTIAPLFWKDVTTYRSQLTDDIFHYSGLDKPMPEFPDVLDQSSIDQKTASSAVLAETATSNLVDSIFELIYFGIQVRAEIPRLMLAYGGVNVQYTTADWSAVK
ncbi:hypothetical protein BG000_001497 [Podila horticola]|nr:hypothetical protein BG000_001497 [Podila horticola]